MMLCSISSCLSRPQFHVKIIAPKNRSLHLRLGSEIVANRDRNGAGLPHTNSLPWVPLFLLKTPFVLHIKAKKPIFIPDGN